MRRLGRHGLDPKAIIKMAGHGTYKGQRFETLFEREGANLSIGKWCSIGDDVQVFLGGNHHADWVTTSPLREDRKSTYSNGDVNIESDVWIGLGAMIMSGVTIRTGAIIAAGSVVTKDVAHYEIVGGNPAKHIRLRHTPEQIAALLKIQWWEWPHDTVFSHQLILCQPDIQKFIDFFLPLDGGVPCPGPFEKDPWGTPESYYEVSRPVR